jgi:hypothetical protein
MIDLIVAFLPGITAPVDSLDDIRPTSNGYSGRLRNMTVSDSTGGVLVKGSLAKFYGGENVTPLCRSQVGDALFDLEKVSGCSLREASLWVLEIGTTLSVDEEPCSYLSAWGHIPRYKRIVYGLHETVVYSQRAKSFMACDKTKEMAPTQLPPTFEGKPALRLEMKIKKDLRRFFGRPLSPWELLEKDNYRFAVRKWKELYQAIPKEKIASLDHSITTPKLWKETLASIGLQNLGYDKAEQIVHELLQKGIIDRSSASRMRKLNRDLSSDLVFTNSTSLVQELDEKVHDSYLKALM